VSINIPACDVPANNMTKLSAAQEDVIDSFLCKKKVPTNEEIVLNTVSAMHKILIEILSFLVRIVLLSFPIGNVLILL
jgi:hypothetical protein